MPVVVCGAKLSESRYVSLVSTLPWGERLIGLLSSASEQVLNDLGMEIPWKLSGSPYESKVSKTEPLNQIRRPSTYWLEFILTTMLLPFLAALALIRVAFRLDLAHYFSKYEAPVKHTIKVQ